MAASNQSRTRACTYTRQYGGYGSLSTSLLKNAVTTGQDGSFTITGDYTCPNTVSQVYLYAVGGDAGAGTEFGRGTAGCAGNVSGRGNAIFFHGCFHG